MVNAKLEVAAPVDPARRILIVDDSRAMRGIVARTLREAGFGAWRVLEAADGAAALELARAERPEAILADWNMPVMDGLALVRALRLEGLPVACGLLTSEAARVRGQALEAGARFVLAKPVTADGLREALGPLLSDARLTVPSAGAVASILSPLFARELQVAPGVRPVFAGSGPLAAAVFERESGAPAALVALDLPLAAAAAAAMAGAPEDQVPRTVGAGQFAEAELETLRELLSVSARLVDPNASARLTLRGPYTLLRSLPPRAVALAIRPESQGLFEVGVAGYGGGALSVCIG
jgi:two-component system chemotaxis response regulator CheY